MVVSSGLPFVVFVIVYHLLGSTNDWPKKIQICLVSCAAKETLLAIAKFVVMRQT